MTLVFEAQTTWNAYGPWRASIHFVKKGQNICISKHLHLFRSRDKDASKQASKQSDKWRRRARASPTRS